MAEAVETQDLARFRKLLGEPMPGSRAYVILLGLDYYDLPSLMKAVEKGFAWKTFERFVRNLGLDAESVADWISIPRRTLARRKAEGRLTSDESDRLLRAARVFSRALQIFDGDGEAARLWLTDLNIALGGVAPIEFARTELGAEEVENLAGRIQHGIFSCFMRAASCSRSLRTRSPAKARAVSADAGTCAERPSSTPADRNRWRRSS